MNAGVALVRAYLRLNGYLTLDEFPVIRHRGDGGYQEVTDVDVMAVRFPRAVHVIPRAGEPPKRSIRLAADPELNPSKEALDVLIAEVKEGKARLNDAMRTHEVLYTALSRIGCVPPNAMNQVISSLKSRGEASITARRGIPARVRLLAFGSGNSGKRQGFTVVSLERVAHFVRGHLERYHDVLNPAELEDPVLGVLHLLLKIS